MLDEKRKRTSLLKKAFVLVWIGEIWNIVEAGIALYSAISSQSVALLGYSLDSFIELFIGGVLIWRLNKELKSGHVGIEDSEKKALRFVHIGFIVLAIFIFVQSLGTLLGYFSQPQESIPGIIVIIASIVIMTAIYFPKIKIADKLDSKALRSEAVQTLICDLQDLTVLIGLGLNALYGWWWADPIAALFLIPFLLKEVFESDDINKNPQR